VFDYWIVSSYGTYGPFSGNSSNFPSSCGNPVGIPCGGTGSSTPAGALANLGAVSTAGGTLTGALNGTSASFSGTVAATNGLLDGNKLQAAPVTVPSALAIYDMRTASTTQATDTTGNGNHCVFGSGAQAPTIASGTLNFNGVNQQYCDTAIPMASAQTIVMAVRIPILNWGTPVPTQTVPLVPVLWNGTDNTCPALASYVWPQEGAVSNGIISQFNQTSDMVLDAYYSHYTGEVMSPIPGYAIIARVIGSTQDQWYINGQPAVWRNPISTAGCTTGNLRIGADLETLPPLIAPANYSLTGDISVAGVWSTELTAAQVASVSAAFAATNDAKNYVPAPQASQSYGGLAPNFYSQVQTVLDSRTFGGSPTVPYSQFLPALLNVTSTVATPSPTTSWIATTTAQPGTTMCQLENRISILGALYDPSAQHNAVIVWGIVNDAGLQEGIDCTSGVVKQLHQIGYDVFLATEISAGPAHPFWDTGTKVLYNQWVRHNWKQLGAVAVVDFGENQYLGCTGCYSNLTYFSDQLHPTPYAMTNILPQVAAIAMQSYYGAGRSGNIVIPDGYHMTPADRNVSVSPTTYGESFFLPACDGLGGFSPTYTVFNASTANIPVTPINFIGGSADVINGQTAAIFTPINDGLTSCMWTTSLSLTSESASSVITKNLVPDSDIKLASTYWSLEASTTILNKGGASSTNAFALSSAGTGTNIAMRSIPFNLVCGKTYTLSAYIDASYATTGTPVIAVYSVDGATTYGQQYQPFGVTGLVSSTFVFAPSGCTSGTLSQVIIAGNNAGSTIASGHSVLWSAPAIVEGSILRPYVANVLDDDTGHILPAALGTQGPAAGYVTTSISGTATLVSGTVTVNSTAACAVSSSCHYSLTRYATNSSVAIGNLSVGTISAGSSFVINSLTATNTIATTDVSSVSWQVN
jgi:hypothetical protein